eukprot:12453416-Ditylum_brightwellii.AAC.1
MGKRTRHINIRYFFVTDRVAAEELRIDYCPTETMIANFYTKPLQDKLFKLFQDAILNVKGSKEAVEEQYQASRREREVSGGKV